MQVNSQIFMPNAIRSCAIPWCAQHDNPGPGEAFHSTNLSVGVETAPDGTEVGVALSRFDNDSQPGPAVVEILFSKDGLFCDVTVAISPAQARRYALAVLAAAVTAEMTNRLI